LLEHRHLFVQDQSVFLASAIANRLVFLIVELGMIVWELLVTIEKMVVEIAEVTGIKNY
jgi:hypothetical protein